MTIHTVEKTGAIGMHSEREIPLNRDQIESFLYRWWESLERPLMTFEEWYYGSGGLKDALDAIAAAKEGV